MHLAAAQTDMHSLGLGPNNRASSGGFRLLRLLRNEQSDNVNRVQHETTCVLVRYEVGLEGR